MLLNRSTRLILLPFFLASFIACGSQHDSASQLDAESRDYTQLQLWVDWYLPGGDYTGLIDLSGSPAFSPNKPTFIHFNGWGIGNGREGRDFISNYVKDGAPDLHVTDLWLERGWNFAVVDWTQFSDEIDLRNAEAKIWTTEGPKKMRWKDSNGKWHEGPSAAVARLVADILEPQLRALKNSEVLFHGHSFGSQLALAVAEELIRRNQINPGINLPQQTVITDAVFTSGAKSYFQGKKPIELGVAAAAKLWEQGIPTTSYKCTGINFSQIAVDSNEALNQQGVLPIQSDFKDIWNFDLNSRHRACKWKYLVSVREENAFIDGKPTKLGIALQDKNLVIDMIRQRKTLSLDKETAEGKFYSTKP